MILQSKNSADTLNSIEELLDVMSATDSFSHLQVMMRHRPEVSVLPQKFLIVTPDDFVVVNLIDLDYKDENVILRLQNTITKKVSETCIHIHDRHFNFLLINWQDIVELVLAEKAVDQGH